MPDNAILIVPIMIFAIPIVAIIASFRYKALELKLNSRRNGDSGEIADLRKRLEEMENRVLTLQDIVISGDYEVQRRLRSRELEMAERPSSESSPSTSSQSRVLREMR